MMETLELSNILNFINDERENKTFLIKLIFDENKNNFFKKENYIFDDVEKEISYVYGGNKKEFNLSKLESILKLIITNNERNYQIYSNSFVTSKIKIDDVVKSFIYIWHEIHGKQFNLKTEKNKYKSTYLLINEFNDKWFDDILIATQICEIRTLQNMPPNLLTINKFTSYAKSLCNQNKSLSLKILEKNEIKKLGMNLILGVNSASKESANVIVIEYKGKESSKQKVTFVGKGITFDSGGYNLKTPGKYMLDMKFDMSGAAIALLLVDTLSKLKVKSNISCVIPITDNMVDSLGQLPETIIESMSGKTIEINNTDAEGRLILADAITYADKKLNSSLIIDLATLTGTVIYALGKYTGAWSTKDSNWLLLEKAAKKQNELIWRMPLDNIYLESLYKNTHADILSCSSTDKADSNIAAAWLNLFANNKDYIHLDIAGSAEENSNGKAPMFRTLIEFVRSLK
ncbi:MAG: leucyl aminopeptidase family protein [Mycoplasma sp.]|nr:leucyl aminopeptidase family protein [Mycoplasma sp.]